MTKLYQVKDRANILSYLAMFRESFMMIKGKCTLLDALIAKERLAKRGKDILDVIFVTKPSLILM